MITPCTHYQGVCDHLVCPREADRAIIVTTDLETLDTDAIPVFVEDEPTRRYDTTVTQEMPCVDLAMLCYDCQLER